MTLRPPTSILFPYTTLFRSEIFSREAGGDVQRFSRRLAELIQPDLPVEALTVDDQRVAVPPGGRVAVPRGRYVGRSEEHTSELQSHSDLVCRLLLEKKKTTQ